MSHLQCLLLFIALLGVVIVDSISQEIPPPDWWILPDLSSTSFFRYVSNHVTWDEADETCRQSKGGLVTADNSNSLRTFIRSNNVTESVWVGRRQLEPGGQFVWSSDEEKDTELQSDDYWLEEVPMSSHPLCVVLDTAAGFRWRPRRCNGTSKAAFICQIDVPSWLFRPSECSCDLDTFLDHETSMSFISATYFPLNSSMEIKYSCNGFYKTRMCTRTKENSMWNLTSSINCQEINETISSSTTTPATEINNESFIKYLHGEINTQSNSTNSPGREELNTTSKESANNMTVEQKNVFEIFASSASLDATESLNMSEKQNITFTDYIVVNDTFEFVNSTTSISSAVNSSDVYDVFSSSGFENDSFSENNNTVNINNEIRGNTSVKILNTLNVQNISNETVNTTLVTPTQINLSKIGTRENSTNSFDNATFDTTMTDETFVTSSQFQEENLNSPNFVLPRPIRSRRTFTSNKKSNNSFYSFVMTRVLG